MSSSTLDYTRIEEERKRKLAAEAQERALAISDYMQTQEEACRSVHCACQYWIGELSGVASEHPALKDICQTCAQAIAEEESSIVSSLQNVRLSMFSVESHDSFMANLRGHNTFIQEHSSSDVIEKRIREKLGTSLRYVETFLTRIESIKAASQNDSVAINREVINQLASYELEKRYSYLKETATVFLKGDLVVERRRLLQDLCDKSDREWISGTSDDLQDILDALSSQISAALEDESLYRETNAYTLHNEEDIKPLSEYQTRVLLCKALFDIRERVLNKAEKEYIRRSVEAALCELGYENSTVWSLGSEQCSVHTASSAADVGLRVVQNSDTLFIEPVRIDTSSARAGRENTAIVGNGGMTPAVAAAQKAYCEKREAFICELKKRGIIVEQSTLTSAGSRFGELKALTKETCGINAEDTRKEDENAWAGNAQSAAADSMIHH